MIRVLLADGSERIVANITRRLGVETDLAVISSAGDGEVAVQEALRLQPDIAVLDADLPGLNGVQATEMLAQYTPRCGVILTTMESESDLYRTAMLAGAREVLHKPYKGDDLVAAVHRVHEFQERRGAAATPVAAPAQAPEDARPGDGEHRRSEGRGRLITVMSGKGGVGKSIVASNLAVLLARAHPFKVAIVDLSLQFGDVAALLDVPAERTIADLAAHDAVADRESIQQTLTNGPEGLRVLAAPGSPELADYVTTAHIRALLDELKRSYEFVIVDTPTQLSEISLEAVESADRVVLVTDLNMTSAKNTRLMLGVLSVLHYDPDHITLVVNNRDASGGSGLDKSQIEAYLGAQATVEVPHDSNAMRQSVARGAPVVLSNPKAPVTGAIQRLADTVVTADQPAPPSSERGGRSRGRPRRILGFARD